ncbi:MAG: low molecular weight phosphotyrosine protein phosphatase [Bacteroidetes bacterium]|nr:MAG: low molecular weight phosphotyrosine protein phosphatase [Bacteroidota bacterium]
MTRVLFVCLGNICRSPLAEGLFKQKVEMAGLSDHYHIDSAGTSDYHIGELPDPRTRENAERNGLSLNSRGRQFSKADFADFDIILTMDRSNFRNVKSLETTLIDDIAEVRMMRDFDLRSPGADVPDPYYGGERGFQDVFDMLDQATEELLRYLEKRRLDT